MSAGDGMAVVAGEIFTPFPVSDLIGIRDGNNAARIPRCLESSVWSVVEASVVGNVGGSDVVVGSLRIF